MKILHKPPCIKQYEAPTVFPIRSPAQMLILIRLPPKGYFLFIMGIPAVSCKETEFEYGVKITKECEKQKFEAN